MKDFDVGKNNCMVDMAVSADKGPFLGVEKANDNLQRALDRFLTYHEKEKKVRHLCTLPPCSTYAKVDFIISTKAFPKCQITQKDQIWK